MTFLVYDPTLGTAVRHGDDLVAAAAAADAVDGYVIDSETRHPVPDDDIAVARRWAAE